MGQAANSNRNAQLDERKSRAAGRRNERGRGEIREAMDEQFAKGKTGGASGASEKINTRGASGYTRGGGGGGGGASSRPSAAANAGKSAVGRSSRSARKRS